MMTPFLETSVAPAKKEGLAGSLSALITSPGRWFAEAFPGITPRTAAGMLLLASLLHAMAGGLSGFSDGTLLRVAILMINAVGMTVLGAAIAWLAGLIGGGPRVRFSGVWMVFAVGASPTLLIAWVPFAFFFTEPWKWWLIGVGLVRGLGMTKGRAAIIVLFTFGAMVTMVLSLLPAVQRLAGHAV